MMSVGANHASGERRTAPGRGRVRPIGEGAGSLGLVMLGTRTVPVAGAGPATVAKGTRCPAVDAGWERADKRGPLASRQMLDRRLR
jgi:hypothetical protein